MQDERQQVIHELVLEWMQRASADLVVARMVDNSQITSEILVFHAQQAAEKALKALLIQRQVDFPPIHSIAALLKLCQEAGYKGIETCQCKVEMSPTLQSRDVPFFGVKRIIR